jgi:hypothetical protein
MRSAFQGSCRVSEAHALLLPLHPLALARGMIGSMGLAQEAAFTKATKSATDSSSARCFA